MANPKDPIESASAEPVIIRPDQPVEESSTPSDNIRRRRRRNVRKSRNKRQRISATPTEAVREITPTWLTTVSNLVLLIAIFTTIFAVHSGFQNDKQPQGDRQTIQQLPVSNQVRPVAEVAKQEAEKSPQAPEATQPPTDAEIQKPEQQAITEEPEQQAIPETSQQEVVEEEQEIEKPAQPTPPKRRLSKQRRPSLNRTIGSTNPWNSGGPLDLDNEVIRQDYKKLYLSDSKTDK